jgi:hypothetical protein
MKLLGSMKNGFEHSPMVVAIESICGIRLDFWWNQ